MGYAALSAETFYSRFFPALTTRVLLACGSAGLFMEQVLAYFLIFCKRIVVRGVPLGPPQARSNVSPHRFSHSDRALAPGAKAS
jgi:hypothetical protein